MSGLTTFERLALQTALGKLFEQQYFDICTIDAMLKVTRTIPDGRLYNAMRLLHCVHYRNMTPELLKEIPDMVAEIFKGPLLDLPGINLVSDPATGRPVLKMLRG